MMVFDGTVHQIYMIRLLSTLRCEAKETMTVTFQSLRWYITLLSNYQLQKMT